MILYVESSAVLRWLFSEALGDAVVGFLRDASTIVTSRLTLIESRRSFRRAVAAGRITEAEAVELSATFAQGAARWSLLEISAEVATRAEQAFPSEPIRSLDAIHLASALLLREELVDLRVLSTDRRIRDNVRLLGFELIPETIDSPPSRID